MNAPETVLVRAAAAADRAWIARELERSWGSTTVVTRGAA
jgi:hypothetical protein